MSNKRTIETGDIEYLAKGFSKISDIIRMKGPDYIIAPVVGAVPFIDILKIVDRKFPLELVQYLPNSSRFPNRNELVSTWFKNFYDKNEVGDKMKILCLDEVLSGTSAVNSYTNFKKSLQERAIKKSEGLENELEARKYYDKKLKQKINYEIIGVAEKRYNRNAKFKKLVNKGYVKLIEFDKIPTVDNIDLNPIRFEKKGTNGQGRTLYLPKIKEFVVTPKYLSFLQNIAAYVGVDPVDVQPIKNLARIEEGLRQAVE